MPFFRSVILYAALALCANPALAQTTALETLRIGEMEKLVLSDGKPLPDAVLLDEGDVEHQLSDQKGKVILLNFWATWCAPCREEMPSLARLQTALGGADFAVVPVATGRNSVEGITKFFAEAGVTNLPILRDPKQTFARDMAVLGLPMTVIVNRQGQEVGRLIGTAAWDAPEAQALIKALIAQE